MLHVWGNCKKKRRRKKTNCVFIKVLLRSVCCMFTVCLTIDYNYGQGALSMLWPCAPTKPQKICIQTPARLTHIQKKLTRTTHTAAAQEKKTNVARSRCVKTMKRCSATQTAYWRIAFVARGCGRKTQPEIDCDERGWRTHVNTFDGC